MSKSILLKIFQILSCYKKEITITIFSTIIISFVGIVDSLLLTYLIDNVLYSNSKITLCTLSFIMFLIAIFHIAIKGIKDIFVQQISYEIEIDLMNKFYCKILKSDNSFFSFHKTGELIARLNDTKIVRSALSEGVISIIANVIMFFVVGIALFLISKVLFIVIFVTIVILSFGVIYFGKFFAKEYPIAMENQAEFQSFINENLSGIEAIKTFPAYKLFTKQYKKLQHEKISVSWNISEKCILQNSFCSLLEKLSAIFILICGTFLVMGQTITLGQLASFISLSGFFTSSVSTLLDLQSGVQESFSAIKRLFDIFDGDIENYDNGVVIDDTVPKLVFKNISFSYPTGGNIYKNFNLEVNPGEWIGFVGKTGSGKSTFVKLLLKLYQPKYGQILWNDIDLKDVNTKILRNKIAYIPQEIFLFSGTILQNITMFDDSIQKEKIIDITKKVGIYEKIMKLKNGFESKVGERGISLSGGEKQKIVICRALVKNASVFIFDEATSNLDKDSERNILAMIKELIKERKTVISIAHRLSFIKNCDKIYYLDNGTIIEQGKYSELKKINGQFNNLSK